MPTPKEKALKLYLESGGKMTSAEIAAKVKTRPNVIGVWKKRDNWEGQLQTKEPAKEPEKEDSKPQPTKVHKERSDVVPIRKRDKFDKALTLFRASGGTITNTNLAREVSVSLATVAKWKGLPEWKEAGSKEPLRIEPSKKELKIEPMPVSRPGSIATFEILQRMDVRLDTQIREAVKLKTDISFLLESMRRDT
jgi:uncharacterized protein YjcR